MSAVPVPGGRLQGAPVDPEQMLDSLRTVGEVELVGEDELDGVGTSHYRARGSASALVGEADAGTLDLLTQGGIEPDVVIDVWMDDSGFARRLESTLEANGVGFAITIDLGRFDEPVEVTLPAEDEIVADEVATSMADLSLVGARIGADCAGALPSG